METESLLGIVVDCDGNHFSSYQSTASLTSIIDEEIGVLGYAPRLMEKPPTSDPRRKICFVMAMFLCLTLTLHVEGLFPIRKQLLDSFIGPIQLLGSPMYTTNSKGGKVVVVQVVKLHFPDDNDRHSVDHSKDEDKADGERKNQKVVVVQVVKMGPPGQKDKGEKDTNDDSDHSPHNDEDYKKYYGKYVDGTKSTTTSSEPSTQRTDADETLSPRNASNSTYPNDSVDHKSNKKEDSKDEVSDSAPSEQNDDDYKKYYGKYVNNTKSNALTVSSESPIQSNNDDVKSSPANTSNPSVSTDSYDQVSDKKADRKRHDQS